MLKFELGCYTTSGGTSTGAQPQAQTKPEEQGPLKLTSLCPAGKLLQTKKT